MAIKISEQSKPQWRYERPHRVRFFVDSVHASYAVNHHDKELYWEMAKKFSQTPEYAWVEANEIDLQYIVDDRAQDWYKQVRFYGDLTEAQYVDYALRFFVHQEEWK